MREMTTGQKLIVTVTVLFMFYFALMTKIGEHTFRFTNNTWKSKNNEIS